jgi:hypothetical protein
VEISFERQLMAPRFQLLPPSTRNLFWPYTTWIWYCRHCQTLSDIANVGRLPTIKMAATETENGNNNSTDWACIPWPDYNSYPTFTTIWRTPVFEKTFFYVFFKFQKTWLFTFFELAFKKRKKTLTRFHSLKLSWQVMWFRQWKRWWVISIVSNLLMT